MFKVTGPMVKTSHVLRFLEYNVERNIYDKSSQTNYYLKSYNWTIAFDCSLLSFHSVILCLNSESLLLNYTSECLQ